MADVTIKDYQDWLKNNKKVKVPKDGEELSTYDELENRALYNQFVREAELRAQKQNAETELQAQKETALRDNYVSQEKAQKQAQDTLSMQGITSGISESGLIDLYAQGAAARAKIISANDSAKNDVLADYRNKVAESKLTTNEAIAEIDAQRLLKQEQDKELEKEKSLAAYQQALEDYSSGFIDEKTYDSILEKNRDNLTDYDISKAATVKDTVKEAYAPYEVEEALNNFDNDMIEFEELKKVYDSYGKYLTSEDKELMDRYNEALEDYESAQRINAAPEQHREQLAQDRQTIAEMAAFNKDGVNIYSSNFQSSELGSFYDTGKSGSKQEELTTKYIDDIKAGKVQIGQVCVFNYGEVLGRMTGNMSGKGGKMSGNRGAYIYKGEGVLKKISNEELEDARIQGKVYVPSGYWLNPITNTLIK